MNVSPALCPAWDAGYRRDLQRFAKLALREKGQSPKPASNLEPARGFEPLTCALRVRCSTTELRRQDSRPHSTREPRECKVTTLRGVACGHPVDTRAEKGAKRGLEPYLSDE